MSYSLLRSRTQIQNQKIQKIIDECRNETNTDLCDVCEAKNVCPYINDIKFCAECEAKQYDLMYGTD